MKDTFKQAIVENYMAGLITPLAIASRIMPKNINPDLHEVVKTDVAAFLKTSEFGEMVVGVQQDAVGSVVTRFKRNVHKYANVIDESAEQTTDVRTRFAAATKGIELAGAGAATKHEIITPMDYLRILERFGKKKKEKVDADGDPGFEPSAAGGTDEGSGSENGGGGSVDGGR